MRDPIEDVKRRLRGIGAVYKGGGSSRGSSWVLPGGQEFFFARTSGRPAIDARVANRKLDALLAPNGHGADVHQTEAAELVAEALPEATLQPEVTPQVRLVPESVPVDSALDTPPSSVMRERWAAAIEQAEAYLARLMAEAQIAEQRVNMLKAMETYVDNPMFEDTLRAVLPNAAPVKAVSPEPPRAIPEPPPQQISEYVQVTRQLVYAAAQTFNDTFTVNNVVDRMVNGAQIDRRERLRVRNSVAQAMITLMERGELLRESKGIGRQQSVFRNPAPRHSETGPIKAEPEASLQL